VDQAGVDAELTGQLVDRPVRLEGGKGHPYSLTGGPVFGVHDRCTLHVILATFRRQSSAGIRAPDRTLPAIGPAGRPAAAG
jgi:hypothetical protein